MAWSVALAVLALLLAAPAEAQSVSCRGYPPAAMVSQIKSRIEALRLIERAKTRLEVAGRHDSSILNMIP